MIKTWKHKGLENFFKTGATKGIQTKHAKNLLSMLLALNTAKKPEDLNIPGYGFHKLKGNRTGTFSIKVNGNWRLTFNFEKQNAILVNYEDYH
jgi:proteic killer suppression protein